MGHRTHRLWGLYTIAVDFARQTVDVINARDAGFHLNVVGFLEPPGCSNCLRLDNFIWGDKHLALDVGFLHPFIGLTEFSGFDVRGIVMFHGNYQFPSTKLRTKGDGDGGLDNPDGYTTLYSIATEEYMKAKMGSPVPPNATLNGYINHYHLEARHMFRPIATPVYHKYEIDFPDDGSFINYFNYAVDASWEFPVKVPATINDFSINANSWEAYQITTELDGLITAMLNSSAVLNIYINDWQGADTISEVNVECPELYTGLRSAALVDSGAYPDWGGWAHYSVNITNEKASLKPEEPFRALVAAKDKLDATDPMDITAYQIYEGTITPNEPPVAKASVDNDKPSTGVKVYFTGHNSYDPEDGNVSEYHWDLDGDGEYDDSIEADPEWIYTKDGTFYIDLKVYDSMGAWDTLDAKIKMVVTAKVEVTLPEYVTQTLSGSSKGFRQKLFASPPSGLIYQWSAGPKLEQNWDFTKYAITETGYRMYKANPWYAYECTSPWLGRPCIETASTGSAALLLYQGEFILDWVFQANLGNNTLNMTGWDGWDELADPLLTEWTWADHVSPTNYWYITFPLSVDHTGHYFSAGTGGRLMWSEWDWILWDYVCSTANFQTKAFKFDVIGQGTIKTDYFTTPTPCILVRHIYNYTLGGGYVLLTKDMIWYEWITGDGSTAAFMTTFNNNANPYGTPGAVTRFNTWAPYEVVGACVIGQRNS